MNFQTISPGEKVIISRGSWHTSTYVDEVERLTKTQIITKKYGRFNRNTGYRVGGGLGHIVKAATDEDIERIRRSNKVSNLKGELFRMVNVSNEALPKNLDRIISSANELRDLLGV